MGVKSVEQAGKAVEDVTKGAGKAVEDVTKGLGDLFKKDKKE